MSSIAPLAILSLAFFALLTMIAVWLHGDRKRQRRDLATARLSRDLHQPRQDGAAARDLLRVARDTHRTAQTHNDWINRELDAIGRKGD